MLGEENSVLAARRGDKQTEEIVLSIISSYDKIDGL